MTLVNMKKLIADADRRGTAVGAFNVGNMEMVMGVVKAAEEMNTSVIMQIAEGRLPFSPLSLIGPAMVAAAENSKVDIAVHLDHGRTEQIIRQALDLGFTSVMFDGSALPYEENVLRTGQVVSWASETGAAVECEIGVVGGNEGNGEHEVKCTTPEEAERFSNESGADVMAVAIGNAHGAYATEPELRFDILNEITKLSRLPLVLHGGSGISDSDFQKAIACGIRKVNVATASFVNTMNFAKDYLTGEGRYCQGDAAKGKLNYFNMSDAMVYGTYENVKRHIRIFSFLD